MKLRVLAPLLPALLMLLMGLMVARAHGQTLVVEFSDAHSAYDRLPNFLRTVGESIREFRAQNPQGQAVILVNGDYSGLSAWTNEDGWLGIKALEHLRRQAPVLFVLGNHDAFDWSDNKRGNELVQRQLARLHQVGVKVLGANMEFGDSVRQLTEPHFDLRAHGKTLRIAALGLENFFVKSNWVNDPVHPIVNRMLDSDRALAEVWERGARDGVHSLVFFQHDGHREVAERVRRLVTYRKGRAGPSLPVVFAAHDHELARFQVQGTEVVDSRSNFDLSTVTLDRDFKFRNAEFYDQSRQQTVAARAARLDDGLERFIRTTENLIAKTARQSGEVLAEMAGFEDYKLTLKDGRRPLGTALAESLRAWGEEEARRLGKARLPVVAMYNSSSYRRDDPVREGALTRGDVRGFYPFPGEVMMFETTLHEAEKLFADLRRWRLAQDGKYTPQLSENLGEGDALTLELRKSNRAKNPRVLLVLDSWLSRNGYAIESFDAFLKTHPPIAGFAHMRLLENFAPRVFERLAPPVKSCRLVHR